MSNTTTHSLLAQLKIATRPMHDATEAVAFAKEMKEGTLTLANYQQLLASNLYIHQSLETAFNSAIAKFSGHPLRLFIDEKSLWLEKDIALTNIPFKKGIFTSILPPKYKSIADLIGGLYVVEGSMLGGRFIVKLLQQNANLKTIPSFHFYSGYAAMTRQRWKLFQELATKSLSTQEEFDAAIEQAKATFVFFQQVYGNKIA